MRIKNNQTPVNMSEYNRMDDEGQKTPALHTSSSAVVDLHSKRIDALSWQAMAGLAGFIVFVLIIYVTWFEYVKP